jgi:hypothetical protein
VLQGEEVLHTREMSSLIHRVGPSVSRPVGPCNVNVGARPTKYSAKVGLRAME